MVHRIKSVRPEEDYVLFVVFQDGTEKKYDMTNLLGMFPQFQAFERQEGLFEGVKVDVGGYGISWDDDLDLDAEELWEEGITVGQQEIDIVSLLATKLVESRKRAGMSQKQLAEAVGIYQAEISKIERGAANPSILTLQRLAEGLNMKLYIDFLQE